MSKRQFRSRDQACDPRPAPDYPTSDGFESGRRAFLVKLGGVLLGAGALAACGNRPVQATPEPDYGGPSGAAPMPDAGIDGQPAPDLYNGPSGVAPAPDAFIDKNDMGIAGGQPAPDAEIDKHDLEVSPGFAPNMDSAIDDSGSCPNP